jgi:hypothetical protein
MSCQIYNPANYDLSQFEPYFNEMYSFFDQKIGFQEPPKLFLDSDPSNQSKILGKTAYYDPNTLEIHVFVDGRHPKDLLRSIAHELIHHQQNLEGRLNVGGYMGDGYYLKNKEMRTLEDEAMKNGNGFMREWEDTKKLEERNKMSLKEWKNNELNQLLLKKFGILKEGVPKYDPEKHGKASEGPGDLRVADMKTPDNKEDDKLVKEEEEMEESELNEEEVEEGRKSARSTDKNKFVGHEDKYQNVREELDAIANLQETVRKIKEAKKVFFKGKRIK